MKKVKDSIQVTRLFCYFLFALMWLPLYSYGQVCINEVMAANVDDFISPVTNFDGWIEIYNSGETDFPLAGCYVTTGKGDTWEIPESACPVPARGFMIVWFDDNEISPTVAPFKLDVDGGDIFLLDISKKQIASVTYPPAIRRTSYARIDEGDNWGTTSIPTPGKNNGIEGFSEIQLQEPKIDTPSQIFSGSISVRVEIPEGAVLRYTTDTTTPTLSNGNESETGIIDISETTNLRIRLFREGYIPSDVVTRSYILKEFESELPIISVVTNDKYLYDDSLGVMVKGVNGKPGNGETAPCNWNMDWDRPVYFAYLNKKGDLLFQQDVNLSITGAWSRNYTPKSFKLKGNKLFGNKKLEYNFFDDKPFINNRTIVLRNGGNDIRSRIIDPAVQTIALRSGIDLELQGYQPVLHYLNGRYVGLINIREPSNKHYVYANYGLDEDEIDLFQVRANRIDFNNGTADAFWKWYDICTQTESGELYEKVKEVVDIDEYINYQALQLYLGNRDWPNSNSKGFRSTAGGRFRMIVYDLDQLFVNDPFKHFQDLAFYGDKEVEMVTIFTNLLKNDMFRKKFIDTYCIMGGSVFEATRANSIIDELAHRIEGTMERENLSPWTSADGLKRKFSSLLNDNIKSLKEYTPMQLADTHSVKMTIRTNKPGGNLFVNDTQIPYNDFNGILFPPVELKAIATAGYLFTGWETPDGVIYSKEPNINVSQDSLSLVARFEVDENNKVGYIRINEISPANDAFINDYYKKTDYVELYNTSPDTIDIAGYYLSDDESHPRKHTIWGGQNVDTKIPGYGYRLVWCDKNSPKTELHTSFKLNAEKGVVILTTPDGSYTERICYKEVLPTQTIGRFPNGGNDVYLFNSPTPGKANRHTSYVKKVSGTEDSITNIDCINTNSILSAYYRNGIVNVKSNCEDNVVRIMNIQGFCIATEKFSFYYNIDMNKEPKGVYIVTINSQNGASYTMKFVK